MSYSTTERIASILQSHERNINERFQSLDERFSKIEKNQERILELLEKINSNNNSNSNNSSKYEKQQQQQQPQPKRRKVAFIMGENGKSKPKFFDDLDARFREFNAELVYITNAEDAGSMDAAILFIYTPTDRIITVLQSSESSLQTLAVLNSTSKPVAIIAGRMSNADSDTETDAFNGTTIVRILYTIAYELLSCPSNTKSINHIQSVFETQWGKEEIEEERLEECRTTSHSDHSSSSQSTHSYDGRNTNRAPEKEKKGGFLGRFIG